MCDISDESSAQCVSVPATTAPPGVAWRRRRELTTSPPPPHADVSGENHDSACQIDNGGVFDVATLLEASLWIQDLVVHTVFDVTLAFAVSGMSL